jgi:sterol 3beta-glucosyltransferase
MGACLRAGTPQVITPFGYDQMFWGYRIARLGVGSVPIEAKTMSPSNLAAAIKLVTTDETIRARAREVGIQVRAERGIENAVIMIETHIQRKQAQCVMS